MRYPELLLSLLRQMASDDFGRINFVMHMGMDTDEQRKAHHLELLRDAGLVEWLDRKLPRIRNDGYDFIEAVDKNPRVKETFLEKLKEGVPLLQAVLSALNLLSG